MIAVIGYITTMILVAIALLHVYWSVGGLWGLAAAIPVVDGQPLLTIGFWDTIVVAIALFVAASICMGSANYRLAFVPPWIYRMGIWFVAIAFLLRAIGEFHYAGLFRTVHDGLFAHWDKVLYTPLCLGIALACIILAIDSRKIDIMSIE
jgi:hypothetical protein